MGRIGLAFQAFFRILFQQDFAQQVRHLEDSPPSTASSPTAKTPPAPTAAVAEPRPSKPAPQRSDALTLLEVLQREARLIDFLQEDLAGYADDQIGAAVREVHQNSRSVLQRVFDLAPIAKDAEGSQLTISAEAPMGRYRVIGKGIERRPVTGVLTHPGWQATRCELPTWTGAAETAFDIAPVEVEVH